MVLGLQPTAKTSIVTRYRPAIIVPASRKGGRGALQKDGVLSKLIAETTSIDYKIALEETKPKSWLKSVCAFANGDGGMLAFGIDDNGRLTGLDDPQHVAEKASELINARIDPTPSFHQEALEEDGCRIVLLRVESGGDCPYVYVGDGSQIVYVRSGNQSLPASSVQLRSLSMRGLHTHFDEIETAFRKDDYSFETLRASYFERTGDRLTDTDFVSFGLAKSDGLLTNAGVLLADQPILRQNRVFCTRWNGLDKAKVDGEVLDDQEYSGCLVKLLREAMDFVDRHNRVAWTKTDDDRIETPSYVMRAVEEALVNALIHRRYEIGGAEVTVFVFDDRLEITSPGGKVDGMLPEDADLGAIESVRRNPVIADLFQRDALHGAQRERPQAHTGAHRTRSELRGTVHAEIRR
ncbi:RNA-binding domain-containing protein [Enteroscipio rubneri]|uniref:RNA-binding domain-containing protein n=1 Tax=Enteroscipio rubneri TaxID=2070686 RepID=UPI003AF0D98B